MLRQARREAGKGDVEDEAKIRSVKLNNSIDQLKECTTQVLSQVAALAKVNARPPQVDEETWHGGMYWHWFLAAACCFRCPRKGLLSNCLC